MPTPAIEQPQPVNSGNYVEMGKTTEAQEGEQSRLDFSDKHLLQSLRYPIDLGTDLIYKHLMRINIYKQKISKITAGTLTPNAYDDAKAGASKAKNLDANLAAGGGALGLQGLIEDLGGGTAVKAAKATTAVGLLNNADLTRKTEKDPIAYISLYMPETMQFTDRHDFDPVSITEALGSIGVAGAVAGGGGLTTGETAAAAAEGSALFGSGVKDLALFSKGYAMNPQLEILYKGSKNREFVFSFKFTPRSQQEAESVESIIKTLRFHAAPEYAVVEGTLNTNASRYFIPPSEFDIEFYIGAERNKHIPRIAQCVLSNVDVNYAAAGQYSTFIDGMPVEISMQLTFTETVVLTKEDIDSGF